MLGKRVDYVAPITFRPMISINGDMECYKYKEQVVFTE